jgi:amylosucrase
VPYSPAAGALFSINEKTGDARISGTLASLCGLEKALSEKNDENISLAIQKILLMQAHSFFIGGLPMLFYGDEVGYLNDYSFLQDDTKSYDNRWMHRPLIDWEKNSRSEVKGTVENQVFSGTQRLLAIRKNLPVVADHNNHSWLVPHVIQVAGFVRTAPGQKPLYCLFNFSGKPAYLPWYAVKEKGLNPDSLVDHWSGETVKVGEDYAYLVMEPYQFFLLEQQ